MLTFITLIISITTNFETSTFGLAACKWVTLSATKACGFAHSVRYEKTLGTVGISLEQCKKTCEDQRVSKNCLGVDYYSVSKLCGRMSKLCSKPSQVKKGGAAYQLLCTHAGVAATSELHVRRAAFRLTTR